MRTITPLFLSSLAAMVAMTAGSSIAFCSETSSADTADARVALLKMLDSLKGSRGKGLEFVADAIDIITSDEGMSKVRDEPVVAKKANGFYSIGQWTYCKEKSECTIVVNGPKSGRWEIIVKIEKKRDLWVASSPYLTRGGKD